MCSPQDAKNMLKNKVELLQTNGENLFGKVFCEYLPESDKSKKFFQGLTIIRNPFNLVFYFSNNRVRAKDRNKSLLVIKAIKKNKIGAGV